MKIQVGLICIFLFVTSGVSIAQNKEQQILPQYAQQLIQKNQNKSGFVILDVRTPYEFQTGHIANAKLLNFYSSNFRSQLAKLDRNKTYLIYCRSGNRSGRSFRLMKQLGFTKIYDVIGGMIRWKQEGLPVQ
ncbi:MAG: rhodanese-related sulfurtransferase [bacterium]|jgi:rhodanese-related sulfurtransferase